MKYLAGEYEVESRGAPYRAERTEVPLSKIYEGDYQEFDDLDEALTSDIEPKDFAKLKVFQAEGVRVNCYAGANREVLVCSVFDFRYSILSGLRTRGDKLQSQLLTYSIKAGRAQSLPAGYDGPPMTFGMYLLDSTVTPLPEGVFPRFGILHFSCDETGRKNFPRDPEPDWKLRWDHKKWATLVPDNFPFVESALLVFEREGVGWFDGCH